MCAYTNLMYNSVNGLKIQKNNFIYQDHRIRQLHTAPQKLNTQIKILIILAILANAVGMFFPCLKSMFSPYYGTIAKHIAITNNWSDLVFSGHDWLDKPHFPFWITALSFKIFGINSFAYILPGFIFNLLGVYYTYRLALLWYNEEIALISALFTLTALHIMLSSIDIRAEAYLIGQIIPACYYWLRYDHESKIKYLLLGATFTALAMMTKGVFTLITITSGIIVLWLFQKRLHTIFKPKWLIAILLSFIYIAPEIISLYIQFDAHPEKLVFARTHVSGIAWFFWGSQFGRFFNTGPISVNKSEDMRYLFFVYTSLWAYLPWWPIFFASLWATIKAKTDASIFLLASFFVTFVIFSVTKFQIDHYTNILFPFASIIAANWLYTQLTDHSKKTSTLIKFICKAEIGIAALLLVLVTILTPLVLSGIYLIIVILLIICSAFAIYRLKDTSCIFKTILHPTLAMCVLFIFVMLVNGIQYAKYDAGYQIARYLNTRDNINVMGYDLDLLSLDFNVHKPYTYFSSNDYEESNPLQGLQNTVAGLTINSPLYIVTEHKNSAVILDNFKSSKIDTAIKGGSIEDYLHNALNLKKLENSLTTYDVIELNPQGIK